MTTRAAAARLLGHRSAKETVAGGPEEAGRRLAALFGIPAETPEAVIVLGQVVANFIDRGDVPDSPKDPDFVEESWSAAGFAAPADGSLARDAMRGFGLLEGQPVAVVMNVCYSAMMGLFYETLVLRGRIKRWTAPWWRRSRCDHSRPTSPAEPFLSGICITYAHSSGREREAP